MRIVFLGTPEFACPSLSALIESGYEVAGVITQPDRPKNRGHALTPPPVKVLAEKHNIPVFQPERIRSENGILEALSPDIMVTAAFGQILSEENLAVPKIGTVNVHASLLPKYRGAAPIEWCILNGERETGVTTMLTDAGLDTGDILLKRSTPIGDEENAGELRERLSHIGAELLLETLRAIEAGSCPRTPQNGEEASYYPMLTREMGYVDFKKSAEETVNVVRALPAYAMYNGERVKLMRAKETAGSGSPGEILCAEDKNGLVVACASGAVRLSRLQLPGGKPMEDTALLRGRRLSGSFG